MQETEATMITSSPLQERAGGAEAHLIDPVVDRHILFNVGIGPGDIGFGLVVVVVGDEILDGVVGKECFKFLIELRGQGFVVGDDEGRSLHIFDHIGHGESLARAGDAQQNLGLSAPQ